MASKQIQNRHLKDGLGRVALDFVSVYDNLDDAVPHLLADVVAGHADEIENGVHVPGVVHGVLLCQDGHLKHLRANKKPGEGGGRAQRVAEWCTGLRR